MKNKKGPSFTDKLIRYINAGFPIVYINSYEELKTDSLIKEVIKGRKTFEWNAAEGIIDFNSGERQEKCGLKEYLSEIVDFGIQSELDRNFLVLKDVHSLLDDKEIVALLKYICLKIIEGMETTIIIVSPVVVIPAELEKFITILEIEYPEQDEIKNQIKNFLINEKAHPISDELMEEVSLALKGLTQFEIKCILSSALADDGELTRDDLKLVISQKQQMIRKSGILEMIPVKEKIEDIGGLENLKNWLAKKAKIFKNINKAQEFGVDVPKGVLIAGYPGCGKSLTAKVAAALFEVPLLRLDIGKILGKYVGESEQNMRRAISLAEAISPCVLWIDELEKAFAGVGSGGEGNEVTVRLFGTFLTWMQEKTAPAFVIATANDITKLPPELMRKGRFDETFSVVNPNSDERRKIFEIHINKHRPQDLKNIEPSMNLLVEKTNGYCGADIEGVVKESVENVFADGRNELTATDILKAISETHPLSEIMKDSLEKMSKEFASRKIKNASN